MLKSQSDETSTLKSTVNQLKQKLEELTSFNIPPAQASTVAVAPSPATNLLPVPNDPKPAEKVAEHKFNVVLYGIPECPNGTSRSEQMKHDLDSTVTTLNKLNNDIYHSSIRDNFRLQKYKQTQGCSRPLLIKLNHAIDVVTILANRSSLSDKSITVKSDMSPDEKQKEALLLKQRWSLMQSGIDKAVIKIKSSSIYVKNRKYSYVSNSVFNFVKYFSSSL